MSRDYRYVLSYEVHQYVTPTPMDKDKEDIKGLRIGSKIVDIDAYTFYVAPYKYGFLPDFIDTLLADTIFSAGDGEPFKQIK